MKSNVAQPKPINAADNAESEMKIHKTGSPRKIAILGSRGIPAEFGGFETFAEQLAVRLVAFGHDVTVYCEKSQSYEEPSYKGVKLVYLETPNIVGLRSVWFDIVSIIQTLRGYDFVYMLGYHAGFAFVLPWAFRTNFWTNMDGLEWKRDKWSPMAKRYLRINEWFAARFSRKLVGDAEGIVQHLRKSYGVDHKTIMLPYGAYRVEQEPDAALVEQFGIEIGEYYLVVCRLEPENHVLEIVQGFVKSKTQRRLVVVGDHKTGTAFVQSLLDTADERVYFVGTIFDHEKLMALRWYCRAYLHGHSVGGTNPSLLEAMTCRNYVIAHDNVFNREVTGGLGTYFASAEQLTAELNDLDVSPIPDAARDGLLERIEHIYNWDRIASLYAEAFESSLG